MGTKNSKAPKQNKAMRKTQLQNPCSNLFNGQQIFQIVGVLSPPQPQQHNYCPQPMPQYAPQPPPPQCYSYPPPPPPQPRYC